VQTYDIFKEEVVFMKTTRKKVRKDLLTQASNVTGMSIVRIVRLTYQDDNTMGIKEINDILYDYQRGKRAPKAVRDYAKRLLEEHEKGKKKK
jgi:hypothetical protein